MFLMINSFVRNDGIVLAITVWQWVLEFFINLIVIILMVRMGGSRQFDHISSLIATWFKVCLVPSLYLMAHASFYRNEFLVLAKIVLFQPVEALTFAAIFPILEKLSVNQSKRF